MSNRKRNAISVLLVSVVWQCTLSALAEEKPAPAQKRPNVSARFSDPALQPAPPEGAVGWPSRAPDLDARPGFKNPPPGYGEVPFWWWSGEDLDVDRMIGQIEELHKKGISGVQVNYSHYDTPGWLTDDREPPIFSDAWWTVYSKVSEACAKRNMGIGLSTYTIDWPRGAENLFYRLFYKKPELNAIALAAGKKVRMKEGETQTMDCAESFAVWAYPVVKGKLERGGKDLTPLMKNGKVIWKAPQGSWEVWSFHTAPKKGSLNPLMSGSGETVVKGFYQPFQDHNPGKTSKGLNYFFNDELHIGLDQHAWNPDFAKEFRQRKGYDLLEVLPAMFTDMGDITPKVRMDYADVRMSLMEERYFKPIYDWHASRGLIFGCDNNGRGLRPNAYGNYFRAVRWYSAPGHDTPGGGANLSKGKVSSSIANLYRRPRVWLEGYHSLGWGASTERLMFATRENYLYGCNLLNLHGLYYSTYGSHWEWAPPCYHFRMPYWAHMGVFLKYFERLSYLMSQGHTVCDVAVVYPVAPYDAWVKRSKARHVAFDMGKQLMKAGINFEFIDNDSLARAKVKDGRLTVDAVGASYQALVIPNMEAVYWDTISKAAAFSEAGGQVYCVGALPSISDRAGRNDPELAAMNDRAFKPAHRMETTEAAAKAIAGAFVQDVRGLKSHVRAFHRKVGSREVYMVMDATPGTVVEFRAKGGVELWDPWTGETQPLRVVKETTTGTQVVLPLQSYEAQLVVFTPGQAHTNPPAVERQLREVKTLAKAWTVSFVPTMDNTYGDFRLPVTPDNKSIGVEARYFACTLETKDLANTAMLPKTDDGKWERQLHGYGPKFCVLGPVPDGIDIDKLDLKLAALKKVDPAEPVVAGGKTLKWKMYDFSWRYGKQGDHGHQGYHGLKRTITDDFICLGKEGRGRNETRYGKEPGGSRYYLWTSATTTKALSASIHASQGPPEDKSHTSPVLKPAAVYVNGARWADLSKPVPLRSGANPTLVRYDHAGRGHFVMRQSDVAIPKARVKLAMRWHNDPGIIPFDIYAGVKPAQWFRCLSAPGTSAIRLQVRGSVKVWLGGKPMADKGKGRFVAVEIPKEAAVLALRIVPEAGCSGGSAIPEPIVVETDGSGVMPLGDWAGIGILNNYSGGVRYRTTVTLSEDQVKGPVEIDLGQVVATAEVHVNGKKAGIRVTPPWRLDVTGLLKAGANTVDVLVYNTLSNHYQTIPSRYRGKPTSGLMGPVRLLSTEAE